MGYALDKASVLIVEDMVPLALVTEKMLKTFGFETVYVAHNVNDAFKLFQKHSPDIILTDWIFEEHSGLELTKLIRRDPLTKNPYVPIILMSGFTHKLHVTQARDIGVSEFLVKPFNAQDLYSHIVQAIEKPRQFVDDGERFFGPDRRRNRAESSYDGPARRYNDAHGASA
tara:strand:+ start:142000 stop:142512 length:513 start_codon:yes stop_codon:yes gene_type:complete